MVADGLAQRLLRADDIVVPYKLVLSCEGRTGLCKSVPNAATCARAREREGERENARRAMPHVLKERARQPCPHTHSCMPCTGVWSRLGGGHAHECVKGDAALIVMPMVESRDARICCVA